MNMLIFGERLKELRQELNLTQKEFAKDLSITPSTLSLYEKGGANPSISVLAEIANTYNVSTDWLLGIDQKTNIDGVKTFSEAFLKIVDLTMCTDLFPSIISEDDHVDLRFYDEIFKRILLEYDKVLELYYHNTINATILQAVIEKIKKDYDYPFEEGEYTSDTHT